MSSLHSALRRPLVVTAVAIVAVIPVKASASHVPTVVMDSTNGSSQLSASRSRQLLGTATRHAATRTPTFSAVPSFLKRKDHLVVQTYAPSKSKCKLAISETGHGNLTSRFLRTGVTGDQEYLWKVPARTRSGDLHLTFSCMGKHAAHRVAYLAGIAHGKNLSGTINVSNIPPGSEPRCHTGCGGAYPPFGSVLLGAGDWFGGVTVYSNGGPGASGEYQCVDLINRFVDRWDLGPPPPGQYAKQMFDSADSRYYDKHPNGSGYVPVRGDIIVLSGGTAGHIAIVDSVGGALGPGVHVVEQNASPTGGNTLSISGSTIAPEWQGYPVIGVLHPIADPFLSINPADSAPFMGDYATTGPHAVAQQNGVVDVFWRTPNGGVGHEFYAPSVGWVSQPLPGSVANGSTINAVAQTDGTVDAFWRTPQGTLGHDFYTASSGWVAGDLGGSALASNPYPIVQASGEIDVFWRMPGDVLGHEYYDPSSGWHNGDLGGSAVASMPHPVVQANGEIDVFWRTPGDVLGHDYYDPSTGWHNGDLGGSPVLSAPSPVEQANGTIDVFWQSTNGVLGHDYYDASTGWHNGDLGGSALASDPHPIVQANGEIDVFWRTPGDVLGHDYYDPSTGWHNGDLGGSAVACGPQGVIQSSGTLDVFWGTPSSGLGHDFYIPGTGWSNGDLGGSVSC